MCVCACRVCIFTSSAVGLVTCSGDLGCLLHLVASLVIGCSVGSQSNHATCKTGQVSHLVLQQSTLPLCYVGQATTGLPHQVGFNCLTHTNRQFESVSQF